MRIVYETRSLSLHTQHAEGSHVPPTRHPPTADEIARARADWGAQLDDLRDVATEATPRTIRELLEWGVESGASSSDVQRLPVALWGLSFADSVHAVLVDAAARQWTDGELVALLRACGADDPEDTFEQLRDEVCDARLLARGRARDALWSMLDAERTISTADGTVDVPDNPTRLATVREILRQYGGHTSRGFAEDVQRELERDERTPAAPRTMTH